MTMFPDGIFVTKHKGVSIYASMGKYQCLFGWVPKQFETLRQAKLAITAWRKT